MNKKLPSISKLPITKKINHNKEVFYSSSKEPSERLSPVFVRETITNPEKQSEIILTKINSVFRSTHHSFKVPVVITTKNKVYETKLIGIIGDKLITIDDDEITIGDILEFNTLKPLDR
ncbi:MAG: hypothetical protein RR047_01870 [Bacilli bacterium]